MKDIDLITLLIMLLIVVLPLSITYLVMKITTKKKRDANETIPPQPSALPQTTNPPRPRAPQADLNGKIQDEVFLQDKEHGAEFLRHADKATFTFALSRVGEVNAYHHYYPINEGFVGSVLNVSCEDQYNEGDMNWADDSAGWMRGAFVVTMGPVEIGEVSETTYNKITGYREPLILLSAVSDNYRVRASLFEGETLYRTFRSYVAGTRYENRVEKIALLKSGDNLDVRPTEFEGEPAAEIWSGFGMIGYVPKKLATEIVSRVRFGSFRSMTITRILSDEESGDKFVDVEISVYAEK